MLKIATHDSASGEKPINFISWLMIPFARTQSKTIAQQIESGCRMFDLHARKVNGTYHPSNGSFVIKRTLEDVIRQIDKVRGDVYVSVTYDSKNITEEEMKEFTTWMKKTKVKYANINWGPVAAKYLDENSEIKWKMLCKADKWPQQESKFIDVNGKTWHKYLPIPWLWKKIYNNKPQFNKRKYIYVDFL